ncbi:peptide chain release factor N(5)-glutamine methyltransferase [Thiomicrorhabdus heinhorstiae]|uniref:Release factor glutamine methyltransferase n=1 Tax=Thiomicrorhabdus heinhorstiae TaxID=2748010 RepID=A0ABS0BWX4_9GAMM|nr:peptide chain release factor N(5)-glutamine methyltransferase [Thiomicrorhabdus heinhorstiae]MBF6058305.1 peptide chain release factor N(5)-glutamine methyltransferase [Thiomicrorhabdus heinhorstiae]
MPTIESALRSAKQAFIDLGLTDSPQLDAEILLAHVLKQNRTYLFTWNDKELNSAQLNEFNALCRQRLSGEPIAHLTGSREFWGMELNVTAATLIPRPDTETLVESVLQKCLTPGSGKHLLDMGTGSGAIALALKKECPAAQVTALDFSKDALQVALSNAQRHALEIEFLHSDWFSALSPEQAFDVIVSNPPYIEENDPHLQQGDVRFEPITALTSGTDGLDDIRLLTRQSRDFLKPHGWLMIEHGYNQAEAVAELFELAGFEKIQSVRDYGDNPRVTLGQAPEQMSE